MYFRNFFSVAARCAAVPLLCLSAGTLMAQATGNCQDIPITWTIYTSYVDPATNLTMQPAITGDGVQVLAKTFAMAERVRLRLKATFTNLPNHPNFLPPATNVSLPNQFGRLTMVQASENGGNRTGQVGARIDF